MKNRFLPIIFLILVTSCSKEKELRTNVPEASVGELNQIILVVEDDLWDGAVGDSIRKRLAAPITGMSEVEPIFDLVQYDPKIFNSKIRKSRNIILFSNKEKHQFNLAKSLYASPQNFFFIRESSSEELIAAFQKQYDSIVQVIRNQEMDEIQHQLIRNAQLNTDNIRELFACTISIPSTYRLVEESNERFVWYQRSLDSGDVNLVLYEVPFHQIHKKGNFYDRMLMARDSVTRIYIKGNQPDSYLITKQSTDPLFFEASLQDFPVLEILGDWEMKNDFMTGPFISYVIKDDYYERYLFIDGFVNNPFKPKRDILMELEAVIATTNFYETKE